MQELFSRGRGPSFFACLAKKLGYMKVRSRAFKKATRPRVTPDRCLYMAVSLPLSSCAFDRLRSVVPHMWATRRAMAARTHTLLEGHGCTSTVHAGGVVSVEGDIGRTLSSIVLAQSAYLELLPNPPRSLCIIYDATRSNFHAVYVGH